jgi:hypothetical protein
LVNGGLLFSLQAHNTWCESRIDKKTKKDLRKMNPKRILALFVAVVATLGIGVLSGCGGGGGGSTTTGNNGNTVTVDSKLFPTQNSYGWVYKFTDGTSGQVANYTISLAGLTTFNGQSAYKLNNSEAPTDPSYISITGEGIADLGIAGEPDTNDWAVRFDLLPGQSKEFTATHNSGTNSGTERYIIKRLDDQSVTVPAGTFNCAVYQRTLLETGGSVTVGHVGDVDTTWYAPNVGPVKATNQSGSGTLATTSTVILQSYGQLS